MRPVDKGDPPLVGYANYSDAIDELKSRLGSYCSYCEQVVSHAPEVEHIQPKSRAPDLRLEWDNFLIGCKSCNSAKGAAEVCLDKVAFPDIDNTFRALRFHSNGKISIDESIDGVASNLIGAVINLVKLHRHPEARLASDRPSKRDDRYKKRAEAWIRASHCLELYEKLYESRFAAFDEDEEIIETILMLAEATGFFSIWMAVFCEHASFLCRIIERFPGTDRKSFNEYGVAIKRPSGRF